MIIGISLLSLAAVAISIELVSETISQAGARKARRSKHGHGGDTVGHQTTVK